MGGVDQPEQVPLWVGVTFKSPRSLHRIRGNAIATRASHSRKRDSKYFAKVVFAALALLPPAST
jgi:hypothetical protein